MGFGDDLDLLDDMDNGNDSEMDRKIAAFDARVKKAMKVLANPKRPIDERIASAQWLGESGDPQAIIALMRVYKKEPKNAPLRSAVVYALGQFKALDQAIQRSPSEPVAEALSNPENALVLELINNLTLEDAFGERKKIAPSLLSRVRIGLLLLFMGLVILNLLTSGGGGGANDTAVASATPAQSPTPQGPTATPTLTETPTLTPTPTITPTPTLAPELLRSEVTALYALLDDLENPRSGAYARLNQFWTDRTRTVCGEPDPVIPENYVIDPSILEREDVSLVRELQLAAQDINVILNFLRGDPTQPETTGWADFRNACNNALLNDEVEVAQATTYMQFLADSLGAARAKLDSIRNQL